MNTLIITIAAIVNVFIYALMIGVGIAMGRVIESREALRDIRALQREIGELHDFHRRLLKKYEKEPS